VGILLWRPLPLPRCIPAEGQLLVTALGALLYFPGIALYLWAFKTLGAEFGVSSLAGAGLYAGHRLVTHGPFGWMRHPMYAGVLLAAVGALLIFCTWATLVFLPMSWVVIVRAWHEEALLDKEFPDEWKQYAARVPRWMPFCTSRLTDEAMKRYLDSGFVIALAALVLVFFWQLAFTNLILVDFDVFTYFYPYREHAAEALGAGRFPLWNPYLFLGAPFFANIQTAVLYPLNALYLLIEPAPRALNVSILLHVTMLAAFTYAFARVGVGLGRWGAFAAAAVFGLGGFVGAQVSHINQLNAAAWLPLILLLFDRAWRRRSVTWAALTGLVVGVQLLAGHTQESYLSLAALGLYALFLFVQGSRGGAGEHTPILLYPHTLRRLVTVFGLLLIVGLVGAGLAAAQLLPTLELSGLSIRGGGMSYQAATSFSLEPWNLPTALLPNYLPDAQLAGEFVGYVGSIALALAIWAIFRGRRDPRVWFFALFALLALSLALGRYNPLYFLAYHAAPGFALFRVPARWLFLYSFGVALLAGLGLDMLETRLLKENGFLRRPKGNGFLRPVVTAILVVELFVAGQALPYNRPTAPEAYTSLRPAVAQLLSTGDIDRFWSLTEFAFDPGDVHELRAIFWPQISKAQTYDFIVATKYKEALTANLPLHYRLSSVDGYDGGVLPLARFVRLEELFVPPEAVSVDGRLRDQLHEVPPGRLLALLNVRYVIADKVHDAWVDGVYYDLGHLALLGPSAARATTAQGLIDFPTNAVGIVSCLDGAASRPDGAPMARLTLTTADGAVYTHTLRAGIDTADGHAGAGSARPVATWRDDPAGQYYHARWDLPATVTPAEIRIESLLEAGTLRLRGLTLIDRAVGAHWPLIVSTTGQFSRVHDGDVKIYENLDCLPRAYVSHNPRLVPDDEAALAALADPTFNPAHEVVLVGEQPPPPAGEGQGGGGLDLLTYQPEHVVVSATLSAPGYLVLSDTYYPGWRATVDGVEVPIERANYLLRAVAAPGGAHRVEFTYWPTHLDVGLLISGGTVGSVTLWLLAALTRRMARRRG